MARKVKKSVQQIAATMVERLWPIQRFIQTPVRTAGGGGVVRMRTTKGCNRESSKDDKRGGMGGSRMMVATVADLNGGRTTKLF